MNARTKTLMAAMLLVGVFAIGDQGYRRLVEVPARMGDRELSRLEKQIKEAENLIFDSKDVADELLALEQVSLPYDEELARAHYQDWLLSLVEAVDLRQPTVDAGVPAAFSVKDRDTRQPKEIYKRFPFSVRGRGTLGQVTQLLYTFYRGGHLHKIRTLTLNPVAGGQELDVSIGIEALGLARCEREAELSKTIGNRLAFSDGDAYRTIVRRNLFSREGETALRSLALSAVTFDRDGRPEAWFTLGPQQPTRRVQRGQSINVAGHQLEVIDILPQMILVEVDGDVVQLGLGKSVYDAQRVGQRLEVAER